MNNTLIAFGQLRERLDVFLGKLEQRAHEVADEARAAAQEIRDLDPDEYQRSYLAFKAGIESKMQEIITKAENTFEERFDMFTDVFEDDNIRHAYKEAERVVEGFVDRIETLSENIFTKVDDKEAEEKYQQAVSDWKAAAAKFSCTQCGAPTPVPQLYYQSQYLPCQGCGTQATFVPSTAMQEAPRWAEAVADQRARAAEQKADEVGNTQSWVGEYLMALVNHQLVRHRHLVKLLPGYAETVAWQIPESIRVEATTKGHTDLEPAGTREADVTYYNVMGSLGESLKVLRRDNDTVIGGVVENIVRALARPDCEVAQSIYDGTFNDDLWNRYAAQAAARPEA